MRIRFFVSLVLIGNIFGVVHAQTRSKLSHIEITEYFNYVPLDKVLQKFTDKYGIKFKYNPGLLRNIEFWYLYDHTPADLAIEVAIREYKLKYFIDAEGVVNIVPKSNVSKPENLLVSEDGYISLTKRRKKKVSSSTPLTTGNPATAVTPEQPVSQEVIAATTPAEETTNSSKEISDILVSELFNNTTLDKIFDRLIESYNVPIVYEKSEVAGIKFWYLFDATPADEVLDVIIRENKLNYNVDLDGMIHIVGPNGSRSTSAVYQKYRGQPEKTNFSLSGVIRDNVTGESLPFVNMGVKGTNISTQSNSDGYFTLLKVPTDTSSIKLSYIGFKPLTIYLNPQMPLKNVVIEMEPSVTNLAEVQVAGEREEVMRTEKVSMFKLTPSKIATLPNVGEKDIFRSFQLLPGISAANENSAGLYVRGGTPDQTLVQYDGFTVYYVDHLYGFFSAFNNNALKDVQLYKGGFEAKYGGRISAVTEITGKEGNRKRFSAGGDFSLLSANAYAEVPIGDKVSVLVAARRSYQGFIYNLISDKYKSSSASTSTAQQPGFGGGRRFGTQSTPSSYFYDLNTKITYHPNKKDIYTLSVYNGADDVDNSQSFTRNFGVSITNNTVDVNNWGNTGFSAKWSRKYSEKFYGNTLFSYSNYFSTRDRTNEGSFTRDGTTTTFKNGVIENNSLNDFSLKSDYEWNVNKDNQIEFGMHLTHYNIIYNYSQSDTVKLIDKNDNGNLYTFYAQDKIKIGNRLNLLPGVRATYYGVTGKVYIEPRFSFTFDITDRIKLKGATGIYNQFTKQVTREDILQGSRNFWVLSDGKNIPISSAQHYILGISYDIGGYLFDVEGYYKPMQNLSDYTLRYSSSLRTISYSENFYVGSGLAKGVDILLQKKVGKYKGWIGYTLAQVTNNYGVYGGTFAAANDVRNEFKVTNMFKWRKWDFALTWIYATGRPYTAPEGAYQVKLLDGTSSDFITVSAKNSQRLPDYHRMDVSATYNFKSKTSDLGGSLAFSIFNLYNRSNVWYKTYSIDSGELIETDVTYMGLTPNISLSIKY